MSNSKCSSLNWNFHFIHLRALEIVEMGIEISFDNDRILSPKSLSSEMSLAVFYIMSRPSCIPLFVKVDSHFNTRKQTYLVTQFVCHVGIIQ